MTKKRTPRARFDNETLRACADLIRRTGESQRVRVSELLARVSRSAGQGGVSQIIQAALGELTLRQREIIVRCDIRGERYSEVAASLYVSERHLFRERRAALAHIAQQLLTADRSAPKPSVTVAPDAVAVQLRTSEALASGGNWRGAAELLEIVAADLDVPEQRGPIEVCLARLYRDADQFTPAYHHADLARKLARAASGDDLQCIEADIAVAEVAGCAGAWKVADALAQRSIAQLRPWSDRSCGSRVPKALAQALLVKAELLAESGGLDLAFTLAAEARRVVSESDAVDSPIGISARAMAALTSIFLARDTHRSEELLWGCYRAALAGGLIRESLIIATHLSVHYRLGDRAERSLRLLAPLVDVARIAGTGWVRGAILSELVYANLATGAFATAAAYLGDLSECAGDNPLTQVSVKTSRAALHLAQREFAPALEAAQAAEVVCTTIGLGRLVGTSLRMQAEALAALGESEGARRTIAQAVDVLKETSEHPLRLAAAYQVMATITGRRHDVIAARKLLREARATSPRPSDEEPASL